MISFFDLLGIARNLSEDDRRALAAQMWPSEEIQPFTGDAFGDTEDYRELMSFLNGCLEFKAVRPGGAGGMVGLSAELHVTSAATLAPQPLVLAKMPDVAYFLQPTLGVPAQLHVTQTPDNKLDVHILGLPVEIKLPPGFIRPQRPPDAADSDDLPDFETTSVPFDVTQPDSLRIVLRDFDPSSIFVRTNVRMTPDFDFVVDTRIPLTIGPCAFLDLPCEALHDLQLIPSPRLQRRGESPVDWARHYLDTFQLSGAIPGLYTFRAIDLDRKAEPVAELLKRISTTRPAPLDPLEPPEQNQLEPIIEDIAFPAFMSPLPIPVHFRLGMRKVIVDPKQPFGEEYKLDTAPVDIPIRSWHLKVFRFFVQTIGEPPLESPEGSDIPVQSLGELNAVLVAGESPENNWSFGIDYSDEGVLIATAIVPVEDRVRLFKILNREVRVLGLKIGYSLFESDPRHISEHRPAIVIPLGDMGWANRLLLLADFEVKNVATEHQFAFTDKAGMDDQPSIFHDLGWYLGGLSLGAFYDPDGIEIAAFKRFRIEIEELAVVTATNGATYLMLSAGIDFGIGAARRSDDPQPPGDAPPSAGGTEAVQRGGGIHFHRLKFRLSTEAGDAPDVLLDGLSLSVQTRTVGLEGFGMISEFFIGGTRLQEFAFALRVRFEALKKRFDIGVGFFYGKATDADRSFNYWLFNLVLGCLPLGTTEARNLRVLVAGNMRPRLPPVDGNPQPLRLFRWYKADGDVISMPLNRQLAKWERFEDSFALGAGARMFLGGTKAVSLDVFFFVHSSPDEAGIFAALEVYLAKGEKPIAYGVLEIDFERGSWAVEIGIALGLDNVLGKIQLPDELKRLASLTGTLFLGHNIDTLAIGQYADPATWLTVRFKWFSGWKAEIWAALCIHHVDTPEGPRVFALSVGAKGTLDIGVGSLKLYATGTLVAGRWRNEAIASGVLVRIEAGVRIRVFRVFNFGAVIEIELDWLGPPPFTRQSFTFRIETPWWLPDVTVRFERSSGAPVVSQMQVASTPLVAASALPPATRAPINVGVTPLAAPSLVETAVFHLDQLRATGAAVVSNAAFAALEPVSVDSTIALDFKPSLDAPVSVVPDTPDDVGTQQSAELKLRYELVEIGIRRRKRFGPQAGVWKDLLTPESTHVDSVEDLTALFTSDVRFEWDVDVIREGRTDTRRLLVNADTAYSLSTYSPEGDDVAATTFPGWPCCNPPRRPRRFHEVDFDDYAPGVRPPASQRFTASRSTFNWQGGPPPVVAPPIRAPAGSRPVFIHMAQRPAGPIAVASFDARAAVCEIYAYWGPAQPDNVFVVEAFDGLRIVAAAQAPMGAASPPVIRISVPKGMTSLLIRKLGRVDVKEGDVELVRVRYRTMREELVDALHAAKCEADEDRVHGAGLLAWLPNCDYEITTRVRVELDHERSGAQDATVEQKAFFRTKGLPGLNAVARVGDEVEPYVESRYPGPGAARLYRLESLAVAFSERFNLLLPVNRAPSTVEEKSQILEWVLAVEKVGGVAGFERVTQTGEDWVVAHRGSVPPVPPRRPRVLTDTIFGAGERSARTFDPLVVRYEAMMNRPGGCAQPPDGLHPSQVLVHAPVDPGASEGATPRWEPDQELRVNLRQKNAPFVERSPFEDADASAFTRAAASGPPAAWRSDQGAMRVDADPQPGAAQYAVFGNNDWRHVQIEVLVDPAGGEAGVAVAVSGSRSVEALLSSAGALRLIERDGATIRTLAGPVDAGTASAGPGNAVTLEVIAFDDRVRATVGETKLEGVLGAIREGRLALVSRAGGRFTRLLVGGLDAWRFHAHTSVYDDFLAHIESWDDVLGVLQPGDVGAAAATVADLTTRTSAQIAEVMTSNADAEKRQRLFETWTLALGLPLRETPHGVSLTRWVEGGSTALILLESDEPLPFSRDVKVVLSRRTRVVRPFPRPEPPIPPRFPLRPLSARAIGDGEGPESAGAVREAPARDPGIDPEAELDRDLERSPLVQFVWTPVATLVLTDREETRVLIIPAAGPIAGGTYRLQFDLDRPRWRTAAPDATSNYRASATLPLAWT